MVTKEFGQLVRTGNVTVGAPNVQYQDKIIPVDKEIVNEIHKETEVPMSFDKIVYQDREVEKEVIKQVRDQ